MSLRSLPVIAALSAVLVAPAAFAKHAHTAGGSVTATSVAAQAKTRDQVKREVLQAQKEGYFDKVRGEAIEAPQFEKAATSSLSRETVRASVRQAQLSGNFGNLRGEGALAPEFQRQVPSVVSRESVRREVIHARHDGALDLMRGDTADFSAAFAAMKGD